MDHELSDSHNVNVNSNKASNQYDRPLEKLQPQTQIRSETENRFVFQ